MSQIMDWDNPNILNSTPPYNNQLIKQQGFSGQCSKVNVPELSPTRPCASSWHVLDLRSAYCLGMNMENNLSSAWVSFSSWISSGRAMQQSGVVKLEHGTVQPKQKCCERMA